MKSILELLIKTIKEYRQYKKDYRRLCEDDLDYEALQRMVNQAVEKDIVIEIKTKDTTITIKPAKADGVQFKSFAERYNEHSLGVK